MALSLVLFIVGFLFILLLLSLYDEDNSFFKTVIEILIGFFSLISQLLYPLVKYIIKKLPRKIRLFEKYLPLIYFKDRDYNYISERELARKYKVNEDTIENWIKCFLPRNLRFAYYFSSKKITPTLKREIIKILGEEYDKKKAKKDLIAEIFKGNGKSRSNNSEKLKMIILSKCPTMANFYNKIRIFPPAVADKI
jgi:hypothetical protein